MNKKIVEFSDQFLSKLTELINSYIYSIPPKWGLSESQVASILEAKTLWSLHYPNDLTNFIPQTICAFREDQLVAASQWGYQGLTNCRKTSQNSVKEAYLLWFLCALNCEKDLKNLLKNILEKSKLMGFSKISIFPRFPFGIGWFGVPVIWEHLINILQEEGFEVEEKWVIMIRNKAFNRYPYFQVPEKLNIQWNIDEKCLEWNLRLYLNESIVGECDAWGIPPYFKDCCNSQEWITIEYIGVEELYRRRGIGKFLMQEQMFFQSQRNISKFMLWTEVKNFAGRQLFKSLNFEYGPECWTFKSMNL